MDLLEELNNVMIQIRLTKTDVQHFVSLKLVGPVSIHLLLQEIQQPVLQFAGMV